MGKVFNPVIYKGLASMHGMDAVPEAFILMNSGNVRESVVTSEGRVSTAVGLPSKPVANEEFANRKLIRPHLNRAEGPNSNNHNHSAPSEKREAGERSRPAAHSGSHSNGKKVAPPEQTNAENFYYQKQMQAKTPMVLVLNDGEKLEGVIEWYDRTCLKLNRIGAPNLMVYKPSIKYMYKGDEK